MTQPEPPQDNPLSENAAHFEPPSIPVDLRPDHVSAAGIVYAIHTQEGDTVYFDIRTPAGNVPFGLLSGPSGVLKEFLGHPIRITIDRLGGGIGP